MSFKYRNILIFLIILSFKKIKNQHPDNLPPDEKDKEGFELDEEEKNNFKDNSKTNNKNNNNNNIIIKNKNELNIKIKDLEEKMKEIKKQNKDYKNKFQKFHLFFYIMAIINVIFAFIILYFIFSKSFDYIIKNIFLKKYNFINSNSSNNTNIDNQRINISNNENVITTSSLVIEGINKNSDIKYDKLDTSGNVAPLSLNQFVQ